MDDLISRAAAIAQIKENYCDWCDHTDLCQSCETRDCIATIEQQLPAVDAVPVVRCRDCKHWCKCDDGISGTCGTLGGLWDENEFCSEGERRESE